MTKRAARLNISTDILRLLLDLPEWCRITAVRQTIDGVMGGTFELCLEGKWLPEVGEGQMPPEVRLLVHRISPGEPAKTELVGLDG